MLKQLAPICFIGAALQAVWLGILALGPLRDHSVPFLACIGLAFTLFIWTYFRVPISGRGGVPAVLFFALLFRLTLLSTEPWQSEDVYRYIWDARVAAAGIDPFRFPPQAPELAHLRDDRIYPLINSKPYITAYPPISQALFRFGRALLGESVSGMKAVFSLLEFLSLLLAWQILRLLKMSLQPLYLVAWNPFFVFEFSASGHSDSGMMFLVMLSLYLMLRSRPSWAMVSYAGAVLSKLHPALWFPFLLRRTGWRSAAAGLIFGSAAALAFFSPSSLMRYLDSLRSYYRLFEFNAGIHYLACYLGKSIWNADWHQRTGPFLAAALVSVGIALWLRFPIRSPLDVVHGGFWITVADLCLSTTVHPWYLSWSALALPLLPYAFMTYWTGAVMLSYLAYQLRPVYEHPWILAVEYVPMFLIMLWEIRQGGPMLENVRRRLC